jgi:hypothetical protein
VVETKVVGPPQYHHRACNTKHTILFFECPVLLQLYEEKSLKIKNFDIVSIFDSDVIVEVAKVISNSPVCNLL